MFPLKRKIKSAENQICGKLNWKLNWKMDWFPLTSDDDDPPPPPIAPPPPPPPPGPLTQGLRQLRHEALHLHSSANQLQQQQPSSPLLFSNNKGDDDDERDEERAEGHSMEFFTQDDEGSFLYRTANDETTNDGPSFTPWAAENVENVEIDNNTAVNADAAIAGGHDASSPNDVEEVQPSINAAPTRLASVVTRPSPREQPRAFRHRRPPPPPLRDTPIHLRLRNIAHSTTSSSQSPICLYCGHSDGRRGTIKCSRCNGHVNSVSCAGFDSHRMAKNMQFTCNKCDPPLSSLPLAVPPPVANRIVIQQSADDTLPAMDDSLMVTPPLSPIHASSPRRNFIHQSPDHSHLASQRPDIQDAPADQLPFGLDDIFSIRVATLRHIPKTAQREMASLKNAVWGDVLRDPENIDAWTVALAHTKLTLFLPPGKKNFKQKSAVVKERIAAFRDGRLQDLWNQATRRPTCIVRANNTNAQPSNNVRRAKLVARPKPSSRKAWISTPILPSTTCERYILSLRLLLLFLLHPPRLTHSLMPRFKKR